ncbi:heat shock protein 70 family, partial [Mycena vulgaris]
MPEHSIWPVDVLACISFLLSLAFYGSRMMPAPTQRLPPQIPAKWSLSGPIIGIDLGTRYSRLGLVVSEERVQIIQAPDGMREIPSDVCFAHNKTFVGHADILRCSQIGGTTVHNIRDLIRHGFTSQHPDILAPYKRTEINRLPTPAKIPSPPQLSPSALTLIAAVLHELRMMAERFHGAPVSQAVITVPLDFDETERRVINEAALLAGLSPVHLLDEPIAVAIAYGLDAPPALSYAVVLDVGVAARATVLRIEARDIQVVATLQNRSLGGDAFNRLLFAHGSDAYRASIHDSLDAVQAVVLEDQVEEAKLKLSFDRDTVIALPIQGGPWFLVPLSRDTFDMIAADLVEAIIARTIDPMLRGAGVPPSAIKHVILAGGSANIPALRARLRQHFPASIHLNVQDPYPEEAVVYGAAMFARRLALGQVPEESRIYTQNMTPMRFGIEGTGGVFATLIPRNSALPARNTRRFRLSGRAVRVFTGTAEYTNSTEFLGSVVLPPNMNPTRLKITFELSTLG